jgi:hypothetical protein
VASADDQSVSYRAFEFSSDPPILEMNSTTGTNVTLLLYGRAGTNYIIQATTNLGVSWTSAKSFVLTNSFRFIGVGGPTNGMMFFRAMRP